MVVDNDPNVMSFDMRFHAFVMAVPLHRLADGRRALTTPVIALNGGDESTLVLALRTIADDIERGGTQDIN